MERTILIYETVDGKRPFSEWLLKLRDRKARAKVRARLDRIQLGNMGDCKSVGDGVAELRIDYGPGYRVYFGERGATVVILLCGGDKSSQQRYIAKAKKFWKEYRDAN